MKRASTFIDSHREFLVGVKKSIDIGNKDLELYVIPALKETLLVDSDRGLLK